MSGKAMIAVTERRDLHHEDSVIKGRNRLNFLNILMK